VQQGYLRTKLVDGESGERQRYCNHPYLRARVERR
jgi:hypothetical protein